MEHVQGGRTRCSALQPQLVRNAPQAGARGAVGTKGSELDPPADGRATFGVILFGRLRDRAVDHDRRRAVALRLLDGKLHAIEVEQEEAKGR